VYGDRAVCELSEALSSQQRQKEIEAFLGAYPPSQLHPGVPWIQITVNKANGTPSCDSKSDGAADSAAAEFDSISTMIDEWEGAALKSGALALALAHKHGCLVGKWMVFCGSKTVDANWTKIARAVAAGKLGYSAKVNPAGTGSSHFVICVYTEDFSDANDLSRVRQSLRALGLRQRLMYKPDAYTYLGIYKDNACNITPVIRSE